MSSTLPRPEYPRPQFVRPDWLNLNGDWEFTFDDENKGLADHWWEHNHFNKTITVPFAYQTTLSGIDTLDIHEVLWYAREFELPEAWTNGNDILLHFGAVDYISTVWLNGQEVGHNQGGNVPFSFDISPYLVSEGPQRLVLRVEDRQDPHQPRGKQSLDGKPREIDYHNTSGIWQTVWLEPVPQLRIHHVDITPNLTRNSFDCTIQLHAPSLLWEVEGIVSWQGTVVAQKRVKTTCASVSLELPIDTPHYWSPDEPNLYDISFRLYQDNALVDSVATYAGLRSISIAKGSILLNNQPLFLAMVLDQGYWPGGGMTAPTDADLRKDVEFMKAFGYNGVRKHQKVEDPRWLYWCDKLGLVVWGEMANARAWSPKAEEWLLREWERVVRRDYNHPCIISWVPMNESWGVPNLKEDHPGQYAYIERIVNSTRRIDPYRPVIDNDGWEHCDIGDICTIHDYTQTADQLRDRYRQTLETGELPSRVWVGTPLYVRGSHYRGQPIILTEVGGFLLIPEQIPTEERDILYNYYGSFETPEELMAKYVNLMEGISSLPFVAGFCYTQLTDIAQEINGIMSFDRKPKVNPEILAGIHSQMINQYTPQS